MSPVVERAVNVLWWRLGILIVASPCILPTVLEGQQNLGSSRAVEAVRIPEGETIRIDGVMDEEVWGMANTIGDFRQRDPIEGGDPSERSEIRILYDQRALYIGAMFFDSDPEGIVAHQLERNAGLGSDDRFMWILDTFKDGRTGYFFETNPAGLMGDGLIAGAGAGGDGNVNKRWDGIWEVRTRISDQGWSAEIRIPFSTINFDPTLDAWGVNFQRTIRRRSEEILWSGWRRNEGLMRPAHAGELRGLVGINQGLGLEVQPHFLASGNQQASTGPSWQRSSSAGVDLTYSITPSLRAAVTVNTDFAEVEVDQRRVNLTRFPLRFPEQRGFFLEGSGVFSFSWADPFFSRRIGLVEGQEVPIRYGGRLGGYSGPYELGMYQVRTGRTTLTSSDGESRLWPAEDFTVGRVRRSVFEQSHVGAIYTRRSSEFEPSDETIVPDRHTVGADFDLFTSRAFGRFNARLEGFMVFHTDPVAGGDLLSAERRGRGYRWILPNDLVGLRYAYRDFGSGWDPAVGFAERRGFGRHLAMLEIRPRPERWPLVRQTEHVLRFEYLTDLDRRLLTRILEGTIVQLNFESGERISIDGGREFERLERVFTIHEADGDTIRIQPGDYESWTWSAAFQSAIRRTISGSGELRRLDFWGGQRTQFDLSATIRPGRGVSLSTAYQRNEVRLPEGDFNVNLARMSWVWSLSPLTALSGTVQYDDVSKVAGVFARLRWIVRPGSEAFFVWTHNWQNQGAHLLDREFTTLSQRAAFKVNYSHRF